jgi:peptidoglycan/LPS O-acetylase OafA/YrhL
VGHIKGLNGLRALAVLAVFASHRTPLRAVKIGHMGVLVFLCLSGFLVGGILHHQRLKMERGEATFATAFATFMRNRVFRIWPIYYLTIAVMSLLALCGIADPTWSWAELPYHLMFLSNVYQSEHAQWFAMGHFWSLAVEMWFYVLFAPLLLLLPSRFHVRACLAIIALGLANNAWLLAQHTDYIAVYTDFATNFALLALGTLLQITFKDRELPKAGFMAWLAGAGVLALCLTPRIETGPGSEPVLLLGAVAAGLLLVAISQAQDGSLVRLLETAPLRTLGAVSYGFYVYHNLYKIEFLGQSFAGKAGDMALNFLAALALCTASWWLIEKPVMRWGRKLRVGPIKAAPVTAAI